MEAFNKILEGGDFSTKDIAGLVDNLASGVNFATKKSGKFGGVAGKLSRVASIASNVADGSERVQDQIELSNNAGKYSAKDFAKRSATNALNTFGDVAGSINPQFDLFYSNIAQPVLEGASDLFIDLLAEIGLLGTTSAEEDAQKEIDRLQGLYYGNIGYNRYGIENLSPKEFDELQQMTRALKSEDLAELHKLTKKYREQWYKQKGYANEDDAIRQHQIERSLPYNYDGNEMARLAEERQRQQFKYDYFKDTPSSNIADYTHKQQDFDKEYEQFKFKHGLTEEKKGVVGRFVSKRGGLSERFAGGNVKNRFVV